MAIDMVVRWQRVSRSAVAELDDHDKVGRGEPTMALSVIVFLF